MESTTTQPRALVVYESMFGNTEQVAEAVAEGLRTAGYDVRCAEVTWAERGPLRDLDLLVVGAPTHAFSLSRPATRADAVRQGAPAARSTLGLREWLTAVPTGAGTPWIAAFDTRVAKTRRLPAGAAHAAARLTRHRGFRSAGRPTPFLVEDIKGPLCDGELERATRWGRILGDASHEQRRDRDPGPETARA